ncbi:hypothetical protein KEM52_000183 [Ascosphaera acerosa]|nr:hypothetical protein KEM52_000183 [Ascosphaera acerosa]
MQPERMIIDLDRQVIRFQGHRGATAPLRASQPVAPPVEHIIRAGSNVSLNPNEDTPVPIHERDRLLARLGADKTYLFEPTHAKVALYSAVPGARTSAVIAQNCTPGPCLIHKGEALGKIRELTKANVLIAATGDPIEALAGGEDGPPTSALEPDSDQTKTVLPSGVTVAGSEVKRAAITDLVERYRQLWIDDGTPAEIPMKY